MMQTKQNMSASDHNTNSPARKQSRNYNDDVDMHAHEETTMIIPATPANRLSLPKSGQDTAAGERK
jgi:hypothetical protein